MGVPDPKAGLENAHVWNKFSVVYYASVSSDLFPLINECVFVCLFVVVLLRNVGLLRYMKQRHLSSLYLIICHFYIFYIFFSQSLYEIYIKQKKKRKKKKRLA